VAVDVTLLRDGPFGACGRPEASVMRDGRRLGRFDVGVPGTACDEACGFGDIDAVAPWADAALLTLLPTTEGRFLDGRPSPPVALPVGPHATGVSVVPIRRANGLPDVEVVVEESDRPGAVVDRSGAVVSRPGPLPGRAKGSVATLAGWYRWHGCTTREGRVEVLDPQTLRAGAPSPSLPCGSTRSLSTADGRLLVECDDGRLELFGAPG
jgi:hypothetical protein